MMDHTLRTISYIADIGDILVIMARRRILASPDETMLRRRRQAKILCHVFESEEVRVVFVCLFVSFCMLLCLMS